MDTPPLTEEKLKQLRELSEDNLNIQNSAKTFSADHISKIIGLLSTGAFVLSINFASFLKGNVEYPWVLIASWFFLTITILGSLRSHWLNVKIADRKATLINESRSKGFNPLWEETIKTDEIIMGISITGGNTNSIMFGALGAGISLLLIFCALNLLSGENSNTPHKQDRENYRHAHYHRR